MDPQSPRDGDKLTRTVSSTSSIRDPVPKSQGESDRRKHPTSTPGLEHTCIHSHTCAYTHVHIHACTQESVLKLYELDTVLKVSCHVNDLILPRNQALL